MDDYDDLPSEYDTIVIGTGLVESIIASAVSRIGKKVLHLDSNIYYGEYWASLGLDGMMNLVRSYNEQPVEPKLVSQEEEYQLFPCQSELAALSDLVYKWYSSSSEVKENTEEANADVNTRLEDNVTTEESGFMRTKEDNKCKDVNQVSSTISETSKQDKEGSLLLEKKETCSKESFEKEEDATCKNNKASHIAEDPSKIADCWSRKRIMDSARKFNMDLAPKVLFSSGAMVNLLLQSCVSRYTEFLSVTGILTIEKGKLELVPCSKSDIFSAKNISVIDKRILMKVLNNCMSMNETLPQYQSYKDATFFNYLKDEKVPDHLIRNIIYSIVMGTKWTPFAEAVKKIKQFLKSIGRYGNSPFLWPMYGSSELLQAFCRLSAVYGGTYYLTRGAEAVAVDKDSNLCAGIVSRKRLIKAKNVIMSFHISPLSFLKEPSTISYISRTILITDRSLFASEKEEILLLYYPLKDDSSKRPVCLIELPSVTGACPNGLYIVHISFINDTLKSNMLCDLIDELFITSNEVKDEDPLFQALINKLNDNFFRTWLINKDLLPKDNIVYAEGKPRVLYSVHYNLQNTEQMEASSLKPSNLYFCHGPNTDIDFEFSIKKAKELFSAMYPEEEFLEAIPDPNEISLSDLIEEKLLVDEVSEEGPGPGGDAPPCQPPEQGSEPPSVQE